MSLTKQILLGVLATVMLVVFGIGSYYASTTLFPEPSSTSTSTVTPTPSTNSAIPTIGDMKRLTPQNISVKAAGENAVLTFTTADSVGAMVYVTPTKTDKIVQAMKDYNNGVAIEGRWFTATSEDAKNVTHELEIPKEILSTTTSTYYYIIVSYKSYWLPYGLTTDFQNGVTEPYTIKL
ncbi:hypothetical protein IT418_00875 [bacterium]|nr:hypothetical protein [bacterium]